MMTPALLYRPTQRWETWVAFAFAITLHLAAISLARNTSTVGSFSPATDPGENGLVGIIEPTPPEDPEATPPDSTNPVKRDDEFVEETSAPAPVRPRKPKKLSASSISGSTSRGGPPSFGSAKASALYAPRPAYPYQARRDHVTGSGLVLLIIDFSTGWVIEARITQSTGSVILDNSAVSGFRQWRFKPGTVTKVQVPITYTLYGASY